MLDTSKTLSSQCYYTFWSSDNLTRCRLANKDYSDFSLIVNCCGVSHVTGALRENYLTQGRRDYYLIIVVTGSMDFSFNGESFTTLGEGDAVLLDKETPFLFQNNPRNESLSYVWVHFSGNDTLRVIESSGIPLNSFFHPGIKDEMVERLEQLFYCYRLSGDRPCYLIEMALRNLLLEVGKLSHAPMESRLDRSIRFIHQNLKNDITLEELAAMEYLGVSRYRELFKATTGKSPGTYITELRMTKAQGLLSDTDVSIQEIAARVGYPDRLYFQRIFKKYVGVTPGEFRKLSK